MTKAKQTKMTEGSKAPTSAKAEVSVPANTASKSKVNERTKTGEGVATDSVPKGVSTSASSADSKAIPRAATAFAAASAATSVAAGSGYPEPAPAKRSGSVGKVVWRVLMVLFGLIVFVVAAFNLYMRVSYASFYDQAQSEFSQPGLSSGFIPQDLAYIASDNTWIFSGYVGEDSASPLMVIASDGRKKEVYVEEPDGETYRGHGSGVSSFGDFVYLTTDHGYLVIPFLEILLASDGTMVRAVYRQSMELDPAFLNIQDGTLFTGVFYREGPYDSPDEMHITTPDGTQNSAVMFAYPSDPSEPYGFATMPDRVYSIPDQVQGFCLRSDGVGMFSTSWGFEPSRYLTYDLTALTQDGTYRVNGKDVLLYCFDSRTFKHELQGPPMGEGIIMHNNRIYIANESASNKYIFGKLMGGQCVYSLPAVEK